VVAEGVEARAQLDTLREMGCNQVQGFLIGRPQATTGFEPERGRRLRAERAA